MNEPFIQSVLYQSPYSGCARFSGWKPATCPKVNNTCWPSPYNAPGALISCDRVRSTCPVPKSGASGLVGTAKAIPVAQVYVTRTHFRPSVPFPMWIRGGPEPLKPMPSAWTQKVGQPPYNLRALSFPSSGGPLIYAIMGGNSAAGGPDMVVGSSGQASGHNLGW